MFAIKVMKYHLPTYQFKFFIKPENASRIYSHNGQNLQHCIATQRLDKDGVTEIQITFFAFCLRWTILCNMKI